MSVLVLVLVAGSQTHSYWHLERADRRVGPVDVASSSAADAQLQVLADL